MATRARELKCRIQTHGWSTKYTSNALQVGEVGGVVGGVFNGLTLNSANLGDSPKRSLNRHPTRFKASPCTQPFRQFRRETARNASAIRKINCKMFSRDEVPARHTKQIHKGRVQSVVLRNCGNRDHCLFGAPPNRTSGFLMVQLFETTVRRVLSNV